jgi:hypothetical protein
MERRKVIRNSKRVGRKGSTYCSPVTSTLTMIAQHNSTTQPGSKVHHFYKLALKAQIASVEMPP